jgi:isorenieratene synthase
VSGQVWRPGRDRKAVKLAAPAGRSRPAGARTVVVIGGGIAGMAAASALAERGVRVTLLERLLQLGGRVRSWPVDQGSDRVTMSRGFHAFFRQYYNLRALLRRANPGLDQLQALADYPLKLAGGHTDSFARIPRTPPWSVAGFVATSPSFGIADLLRVDVGQALGLLDVDFPQTFTDYDGVSAAQFLDRLRFPDRARHLALEVFARSFFADPSEFAAGELIAMFHSYFVGSAEGLLFDVPTDDYDTALWAPLAAWMTSCGAQIRTGASVTGIDLSGPGVRVQYQPSHSEHHVPHTSHSEHHVPHSIGAAPQEDLTADAAVIAVDPGSLAKLAGHRVFAADESWRGRVRSVRTAPPFAVWRLWLDTPVRRDRAAFLGTSGYGPLDNISVLNHFEAGAADWATRHGGSVLELHAYALTSEPDPAAVAGLQYQLRAALAEIYPETAAAQVVFEQWRIDADCALAGLTPWRDRPTVQTPDRRLMLAGDALRCDLPVALMERAATTGFQAANRLLAQWGLRGHELWSVPLRARQRWPGRLRRLLAQPGNSPRRRSSYRRSA